jgi:hypothetical protein
MADGRDYCSEIDADCSLVRDLHNEVANLKEAVVEEQRLCALKCRSLAEQLAAAERERDEAVLSTHRQAECISRCGAILGSDVSATIDGLPRAVRHIKEQLTAAHAEVERMSEKLDKKIVLLGLIEGYVLAGNWEEVKSLVADDIAERQASLLAALRPAPESKEAKP